MIPVELIAGLSFLGGCGVGAIGWSFVIARDSTLARIQPDEQIIKRPHPELVLVQVTPDIARRLVMQSGELPSPNPSEARSLYPEKVMRRPLAPTSSADDAEQD